jgi:hypothetical protein
MELQLTHPNIYTVLLNISKSTSNSGSFLQANVGHENHETSEFINFFPADNGAK